MFDMKLGKCMWVHRNLKISSIWDKPLYLYGLMTLMAKINIHLFSGTGVIYEYQ